jgi:hypothetical protein
MNNKQISTKQQTKQGDVSHDPEQTLPNFCEGVTDLAQTSGTSSEATSAHIVPQDITAPSKTEKGMNKKINALYPRIGSTSAKSAPPDEADLNNKQLGLFQTFLCNTEDERKKLSNTIELWDSVPRFSVTRRQQNSLRDPKTDTLPIYPLTFNYRGTMFRAEIRPAKLNALNEQGKPLLNENGSPKSVDYYPSNREELVEDALRKLASQQRYGFILQPPNEASGVTFSLNELMMELKARGHTFSYQEIVQSLYILHFSFIDIFAEGNGEEGRMSSPYLPLLTSVGKKQLNVDSDAKWIVHFHPFITLGIAALAYRQFNYELMMSLSTQLARWLHKYLCMKFTQAGLMAPPFAIYYKTIKRDSGLLKQKQERNNYGDIEDALNELKARNVLGSWKKKETLGPRGKILDAIYYLTPSLAFIGEAKAANKRQANVTAAALCKKYPLNL